MTTELTQFAIEFDRAAVADACRRHGVRQLDLFGSVVTAEVDPASSDINP